MAKSKNKKAGIAKIREAFNDTNRYGTGPGSEYQELVKKVRKAWYDIQSMPYSKQPSNKTEIYKQIQKMI